MTQHRPVNQVPREHAAERAVRRLAAAWNTACPDLRRAWLRQALRDDALYADASVVLRGTAALARYMDGVHARLGRARFSIDAPRLDGDAVHLRWQLRDPRHPETALLSGRFDARLGADGRFSTMVSALEATLTT